MHFTSAKPVDKIQMLGREDVHNLNAKLKKMGDNKIQAGSKRSSIIIPITKDIAARSIGNERILL